MTKKKRSLKKVKVRPKRLRSLERKLAGGWNQHMDDVAPKIKAMKERRGPI